MSRLKQVIRSLVPAPLWSKLRIMRIRRSISAFPLQDVQHTYGGFPLKVRLADPMAKGWYDRDWAELGEIAFLRKHRLVPGAKVFDLGAHQAVVAMMLAKIVGPTGSVLAVEANSHNAAIARHNVETNQLAQLQVLHGAVAEKSGTVTFNEGLNGQMDDGSGAWGRVSVPSFSVDDLVKKFFVPEILFIDVEGFECAVLKGAARTLATRPDCFIEVHVKQGLETFGGSVEQLASHFPPEFYERFMLRDKENEVHRFELGHPLTQDRFFFIAIAK